MTAAAVGAYLEARSTDPGLEEAKARMDAAREQARQRRAKEKEAGEPGLAMQSFQAIVDAKHLLPNVAIAAYEGIKATANTVLNTATDMANATGLPQAAGAVKQLSEGVEDPVMKPHTQVNLETLFPDFMKAADGLRDRVGKNSTTMDRVVQAGLQFMVPFTGALKATKFSEAGSLLEKVGTFVASDIATSYTVWDPHMTRFGDLLRQLAPDNRLVARFTDAVASTDDETEAEGRWKNAVDSLEMQALLGPLILAGGALIRGGPKLVESMLKMEGPGMGLPAAQRGSVGGVTRPPPASPLVADPAEVAARLGRREKRFVKGTDPGAAKNPVVLLKPKPGFEHLPDLHMGPVTGEQWAARVEAHLSPEEIVKAREWYRDVRGVFHQAYGAEEGDKEMAAWLIANQRASPAVAEMNVLRTGEQMRVPLKNQKKGGLSDQSVRTVLSGEPLTSGAGQKLYDFVDSAAGKLTRSYYGDHPSAGAPAAIDVYSSRDSGLVDDVLIGALDKRGYDVSSLKADLVGAPSETQYEWAGDRIRQITMELNDSGFAQKYGGKPLEANETQAIGWHVMEKVSGTASGQSAREAIEYNTRRIAYELSPAADSPFGKKYGARFNVLPFEEKAAVSRNALDHATNLVTEAAGVRVSGLLHGTGRWMNYPVEPSTVASLLSSPERAELVANSLGYLLNQKQVWISTVKDTTKNPKGFAISITAPGDELANDESIMALWKHVLDNDPTGLVQGYQPLKTRGGETGILILVDKGGAKTAARITDELVPTLHRLPNSDRLQIRADEANIVKVGDSERYDSNGYLARIRELGAGAWAKRLPAHRGELEKVFADELDRAEARLAQASAPASAESEQAAKVAAPGHGPGFDAQKLADEILNRPGEREVVDRLYQQNREKILKGGKK